MDRDIVTGVGAIFLILVFVLSFWLALVGGIAYIVKTLFF